MRPLISSASDCAGLSQDQTEFSWPKVFDYPLTHQLPPAGSARALPLSKVACYSFAHVDVNKTRLLIANLLSPPLGP